MKKAIILILAISLSSCGKKAQTDLSASKQPNNLASISINKANIQDEFMRAIINKDASLVRQLITLGADVNKKDEEQNSPLSYALKLNSLEMINLLTKSGASFYDIDSEGNSAVHLAIKEENLTTLFHFIKLGSDLFIKNKEGMTPLDIAAQKNYKKGVKILICFNNISTNISLNYKQLKYSTSSQAIQKIFILDEKLHQGSDPDKLLKTVISDSFIDGIEIIGSMHDLKSLSSGKNLFSSIIRATNLSFLENDQRLANKLLDLKFNVNGEKDDTEIPLITASSLGHNEYVSYLLEKRANVNIINKDGETPLYVAVKNLMVETANILLENGAKVEYTYHEPSKLIKVDICKALPKIKKTLFRGFDQTQKEKVESLKELLSCKKNN